MSSPVDAVQVQFTIDDRERGEAIVEELLRARLIACAQCVEPVTSRYWWQGTVERSEECLFVCKTTRGRLDEVIETIRSRHPYDVPEVVALPIVGGLGAYIDWIAAETRSAPDG